MSESGSAATQWLKYGCFGCLGVLAAIVLIVGAAAGLAWQRGRAMNPQDQTLTRDLSAPASGSAGGEISPEALAADLPGAEKELLGGGAVRVLLDLSTADFQIEPAAPGEPLRVEGKFDPRYYSLEESYETGDESAATYRVGFRRISEWGFLTAIAEFMSGKIPEVHVYLPRDVPMDLSLSLTRGSLRAELGGLWVRTAEIDMSVFASHITFHEPLREPMESLKFDGRRGDFNIDALGNASPRKVDVRCSRVGLNLDLSGPWRQDAEISIDSQMGEVAVLRLPKDVNLKGLGSDVKVPTTSPDPGAPTLTFSISAKKGKLHFY